MVGMGGDKMAKNGQKCWSQPGFEPGAFQRPKKVRIFCLKLSHWATEALHKAQSKYCFKICKQQTLYNKYGTWIEYDPYYTWNV